MSDVEALLAKAKVCVSPTTSGRPRFQTKHLQALARGVYSLTHLHACFHLHALGRKGCICVSIYLSICSAAPTHPHARGTCVRTRTLCHQSRFPWSLQKRVRWATTFLSTHLQPNPTDPANLRQTVVAVSFCVCVSVAMSMSGCVCVFFSL